MMTWERKWRRTHASKNGKRYRYYVSKQLITGDREGARAGRRVPASDIEAIVIQRVIGFLHSRQELLGALGSTWVRPGLIEKAQKLANELNELGIREQRTMLGTLVQRVELQAQRVELHVPTGQLLRRLQTEHPVDPSEPEQTNVVILTIPAALQRVGMEMKLVIDGVTAPAVDLMLLRLIGKAQRLRNQLLGGNGQTISNLAKAKGVSGSYLSRVFRLAFLSPSIVTAIMEGRQPIGLSATKLMQLRTLPLDWHQQHQLLDFA